MLLLNEGLANGKRKQKGGARGGSAKWRVHDLWDTPSPNGLVLTLKTGQVKRYYLNYARSWINFKNRNGEHYAQNLPLACLLRECASPPRKQVSRLEEGSAIPAGTRLIKVQGSRPRPLLQSWLQRPVTFIFLHTAPEVWVHRGESIRRARASMIEHGLHFPETDPNIITKTFPIICASELCRWLTESMLGKTAGHASLWFSQPWSEKGAAIYHVRLPGCCEVHGS